MSSQADELVRFLRVMDEAGCLEHVVLIGSWAEYVWWHADLMEGFRPNIRTLDIDLLVRNMRRPVPEAHLTAVAREHGYLVESDRLTRVTKIYSLGGLEIEFLIGKVGARRESSLNTNLGVVAQSLRHLDVLDRFTIEVDLEGLRLRVPTPRSVCGTQDGGEPREGTQEGKGRQGDRAHVAPPRSRLPRDRAGIVHKEGAVACRRVHGASRAGRICVGAAPPRCMPHDAEPCTVKQAACTHGSPKCQEGSSPF